MVTMPSAKTLLFLLLGAVAVLFCAGWVRELTRQQQEIARVFNAVPA